MAALTTPAQVEIDFEVNQTIKNELALKRKKEGAGMKRERYLGIMIEQQFKLISILDKKKMTFEDLLTYLKTK